MPVYHFRAENSLGQEITGNCNAANKASAVCMLRRKNYFPLEIKEQNNLFRSPLVKNLLRKVKVRDLAVLCRQFSTLVNAGVPILAALDITRKQMENSGLREALDNLYREVQKGKNLSQVMRTQRDVFPYLLVNMVEVGEISGTLDNVLDRMAVHYEKEYGVMQKVKNALVYPSMVAIAAILVVVFLITFMLPSYVSMYGQIGLILPASTRVLISVSYFIRDNWFLLLIIFGSLMTGFEIFIKTGRGREVYDRLKLTFPLIGNINKKVITVRFSRTLGILLASGISLLQGIEITKKVIENSVIARGLIRVEDDIKRGRGLGASLENVKAFPIMLTHMIKIGEGSGTLDYVLEKTADFYDSEVENAVARIITLLEPVIIIIMAAIVTFIVISIVVPMLDIITHVEF